MKTFLVCSDSHGRRGALDRVRPLIAENDFFIHLGDGSSDAREILSLYPEKTYICRGNCDFAFGEAEYVLQAEGLSVLACHGHRYGVKRGLEGLAARAKQLGCEVALYGHTHIADVRTVDGVLCVNPGALASYAEASYCYLVLHRGKATPTIVPVS